MNQPTRTDNAIHHNGYLGKFTNILPRFYNATIGTTVGQALYLLLVFIFRYLRNNGYNWQFRSDMLGIVKSAEDHGCRLEDTFEGAYFRRSLSRPSFKWRLAKKRTAARWLRGILFSPAYDLLNVNLIYSKDQEELALTLNARKRKIKRADFDHFATSLGIADKVRDNVYQTFSIRANEIQAWIDRSFLTNGHKEEYTAIVLKKLNQIGL